MIPTTRHPQYITNESGEKIAVVLPVEEFEARIEDFEDLAAAAERRDESSNSHEAVVAALKADGFYQVRWKAPAEKELRKLPKEVISRIVAAVDLLADNPPFQAVRESSPEAKVSTGFALANTGSFIPSISAF